MAVPSAVAASQSQEVSAAPAPSSPPKISVQEYLAMERESEVRHEYFNGEIRAMAGESPRHNIIGGNIYYAFRIAFEDRPCNAYFEGVRLRVTPTSNS